MPDDAQLCPHCQQQVQETIPIHQAAAASNQGQPVEIKSGLVLAILVTLFCCLPFGIVAIIYASKVSGLAAAGDIAGAQDAAKKSSMWSWVSFIVGFLVDVIYIFIYVLAAAN